MKIKKFSTWQAVDELIREMSRVENILKQDGGEDLAKEIFKLRQDLQFEFDTNVTEKN